MSSKRPRFAFFRRARFRLTLYYTAIQLLFLIALGVFLYIRNDRSMVIELEKFIKDDAHDLMLNVYGHPNDWAATQRRLDYESRGERYYELSYRLYDPTGKLMASSRTFREKRADGQNLIGPISEDTLHDALEGEAIEDFVHLPGRPSRHLLITRPTADPATGETRYVVQALAYLEPLDKLSRRYRHNILSAIPVFVLISWFGGYALARKVLKPVFQIARTARQITSARLNERLARSNSGDEFDMLAVTLNDMIHRLEESFALLRQFAADAAHELRTPLTIMKGEAEIALRSNTDDPEAYRGVLESSIRECDHMIGIITNLLFLSQADTGDVAIDRQPFRLDELLAEIVETFQILAEEAQIALEGDDFPEVTIQGDRCRLHELFANLVDNAVKYTPANGRVAITCEVDAQEVHVTIADTGIGIPEDQQEKIFERFYRVDRSRSRETGGYGLGLSIARWIANAHGGRITVHSAPGAGSTFTVGLPLLAAAAGADGADSPSRTSNGMARSA